MPEPAAHPAPPPPSTAAPALTIRRYLIDDPISAITDLLHRAYTGQHAIGLRPLAGHQDDKTTLGRVLNSECYLALIPDENDPHHQRIVGVILFNEHEHVAFPEFFLRPEVAHFAMFAVEPGLQGAGIGNALLERCEARARELAFRELALSMAEPDTALCEYYQRRGYRFIEHWQWPYTNYRSCILSMPIV